MTLGLACGVKLRSFGVDPDEPGNGSVVGSLYFGREQATRQFSAATMVDDALAALSLPLAGLVGTGAFGRVVPDAAFHDWLLMADVAF